MTWPALTPLKFGAVCTVTAVLLITISGGLVWLILRWLPRKWREASERVNRLADLSRCDWCDGFTSDPSRCDCTGEPCTFVPLCQPLKGTGQ